MRTAITTLALLALSSGCTGGGSSSKTAAADKTATSKTDAGETTSPKTAATPSAPKAIDGPAYLQTLAKAPHVTLYSLEPGPRAEPRPEQFHGHQVIGKLELDAAQRAEALKAIAKGIADGTERARCFEPRHGLSGGGVDLVICFACSAVKIRPNGGTVPTTAAAKPVLNRILKAKGIRVAK